MRYLICFEVLLPVDVFLLRVDSGKRGNHYGIKTCFDSISVWEKHFGDCYKLLIVCLSIVFIEIWGERLFKNFIRTN